MRTNTSASHPSPVRATHTYIRYRPTDPDQLADAGLALVLEPLDETVAAGALLHTTQTCCNPSGA